MHRSRPPPICSKIPIFLRWAQYLCSLKYAINLVLLTEFAPGNPNCQVRLLQRGLDV